MRARRAVGLGLIVSALSVGAWRWTDRSPGVHHLPNTEYRTPNTEYRDGPPPGHTGGFGEPTCARCHFDGEMNAPGGTLSIQGLPGAYRPGARYRFSVLLTRPGMGRAGFQLAIRFADGPQAGAQAGSLARVDGRVQVVGAPGSDIQYAEHTGPGAGLSATDTAHWGLEWTAPDSTAGSVRINVAGNAANYDDSAFGDYIYMTAATVPAAIHGGRAGSRVPATASGKPLTEHR